MLEHTSAYYNVPPLCDEGETFPDLYSRLGPCDLQEPVWAKMSSALTAGVAKKRKKSDTKPQAQINKCQNEKKRREQENIYIEELAELISANFSDMSSISVKPDKCAILQETVNQIRSIKQRESASLATDPVQQGEVSSSKPTVISNEIYGPLLLEALEGFLFVVNAEGRVEHVTDNVVTYIKFTRDEVYGKSIYNFIHHGDHARFSALLPMAIAAFTGDPSQVGGGGGVTGAGTGGKSRSYSLRFLVKSDELDDTIEEKQQRVSQYESMHISSTQLRHADDEPGGETGPRLLCVASRITYRDKVLNSSLIEQFTTKLDTNGKIIGIDVSSISLQYTQFLNKDLVGRLLQDICLPQDLNKFLQHLRDTMSAGQNTSPIYRIRAGHEKYVQVRTKSKLFKQNPTLSTDTDFVMATHSIISDDCTGPSDPGGGGSAVSCLGGPLMTSIVNGTNRNGGGMPVSSGSDSSTTTFGGSMLVTSGGSAAFTNLSLDNDYFNDFPPPWDLEAPWSEARPDSRQSIVTTPVSTPTPRPPSVPTYSPLGSAVPPSPLNHFPQPSPSGSSAHHLPTGSNPFAYSPLAEASDFMDTTPPPDTKPDTKAGVLDSVPTESGRLRDLLTPKNDDTILKKLLNQPDDDDGDSRVRSPRVPHSPIMHSLVVKAGTSELPKSTTSGGMLLRLLNDKNDDDDVEQRVGLKNGSELLQELLKDDEKTPNPNEKLLVSLGFPPTDGDSSRAPKRPSDDSEADDGQVRVSSTGSKLCQKNKMLAQLLATAVPRQHHPIPPMPASVISATPQEKLPRVTADPTTLLKLRPGSQNNNSTTLNMNQPQQTQETVPQLPPQPPQPQTPQQQQVRRAPGRPSNNSYLTQILAPSAPPRSAYNAVDSTFNQPPVSSTPDLLWNDHGSSDPVLSSLLDQVVDHLPDDLANQNDIQMLDSMSSPNSGKNLWERGQMSKTMAINIIQESLMQCESAVKSPSTPTITLPGTSPAYNTNTIANTNQGYPPPPNYPRMGNMPRPLRPGTGPYQQLTHQQIRLQQQQRKNAQQEKKRLLERQIDQQFVIPSNASVDPSGLNNAVPIGNIDTLLNNTVAPNVSLQRSSSMPESQLSPGYQVNQAGQQRLAQVNQQPYSPHAQMTSPIAQQQTNFAPGNPAANFQTAGARLSPHPPFNQQLSPRQQAYQQQAVTAPNANWPQQQATGRLSVQQQQNPMLNAQLTGNFVPGPNGRGFPVQRNTPQQPRAVGSPGAAGGTRHSPFPAEQQFQPPASPNSGFNQSQYLRMQRANSAPTATTQLPGGLASPRQYGRDHPPPHTYSSLPPNPHHHPMMYQQESSYNYDQTGLQLPPYNGADRGRIPPHLQAGVSAGNTGTTSDYVRQELRAVVGARAGQQVQQQMTNTTRPQQVQQQQQLLNQNTPDLEALGLSYEMPTSGASDSPKLWGAMGSDLGSMSPPQAATSRTTMEEGRQGDHNPSLLQKLLSE